MKVVDAVWEKRNLGVNTLEITLEKMDEGKSCEILKADIERIIEEKKAEYVVCKIPASIVLYASMIGKLGFTFIESQFSINGGFSKALEVVDQPIYKRKDIECIRDNSSISFNKVKSLLLEGMFDTDRVALDEKFGVKIANTRYLNWINDIEKTESKDLCIVTYKNEVIGFLLGQSDGDLLKLPLGGVAKKYKSAFGGLVYGLCFSSFSKNYKRLETSFSSNNLGIVNLYSYFGFPIREITYVFTKHIKR